MPVELNHTIVHARDNRESAEFFTDLLGLEITVTPTRSGNARV